MEINIRRALEKDCSRMLELIQELATFERAPDQVTITPQHFKEAGFGQNPVWKAFLGTIISEHGEENIIGMSLYFIHFSTWKGSKLYLEDLIVTESARGLGLGQMLFEKTLQETRDLNLGGMMWQVLDWNEPAIRFYKKYGAEISNEWLNCSISLKP